MAEGCGASCARIVLIIFNIVFWLSGAALMGVGIWIIVDEGVQDRLEFLKIFAESGDLLGYVSYVLIAVGALIFIIGFLGCCGALRENQCMLGTYVFLLVIIMLAEIAVAVLAIVYRNQIEAGASEVFREELDENYDIIEDGTSDENKLAFWQAVDFIQKEGECCGFDNVTDYSDIGYVPGTCCVNEADIEETTTGFEECIWNDNESKVYDVGCKEFILDWVDDNSVIIIGIGIGIACIEIFGIIFGICLCRNVEE